VTTTDYWRQDALIRQDRLDFPITFAGAGAVGSLAALAVAKLGCRRLTLFDPDRVEAHNVPNQLYGPADLGRPKVDALADVLERLTGHRPSAVHDVLPDRAHPGLLVCAVDSMAARASIWGASARYQPAVPLLVDARMGGEVGRVLAVNPTDPDDVSFYETTLHDDAAADPEPCFDQSVGYATLVLAGLVATMVKRFAAGETIPAETVIDLATFTLLSRSAGGAFNG
jgi:molybdopterin/thiamine biosynthesis adenylyltransferase